MSEVLNVESIFAENVFTIGKMKERLPRKIFQEVKKKIKLVIEKLEILVEQLFGCSCCCCCCT